MQVLDDAAVRRRLQPAMAIAAVRACLEAERSGGLIAPARVRASLGDGDIIWPGHSWAGPGPAPSGPWRSTCWPTRPRPRSA